MYKLNLECKTITPMFMYGADKNTPELRTSEFKGMMRWWWRAIKAEDNIENLRKEEAEIFGGVGEIENKSKVSIIVKRSDGNNNHIGKNVKKDYNLKWQYQDNQRRNVGEHEGIAYLLYSVILPGKEKKFFKDLEFEIILTSDDKKSFEKACASLWLAVYLGGFGARSRRGGGNLEIVDWDCTPKNLLSIKFKCDSKKVDQLEEFMKNNLCEIKKICGHLSGSNKYYNLKDAKILLFNPRDSWEEALNFLGEEYMKFRIDNKSKIFETPIFGMPVMHSGFKVRMVPYIKNEQDEKRISERLASPLIFKVVKGDKKFFPILVSLSGRLIAYVGKEKKEVREEYRRNEEWELDEVKELKDTLMLNFLDKIKNNDKNNKEIAI